MALITSDLKLPDYENEYYNVSVDTLGQSSKNDFTVFFNTPLEQVVQVRLLAAKINTTANVVYMSIDQLDTNFSKKTVADLDSSNNKNELNRNFATIINDGTGVVYYKNNYNMAHQYLFPIQKLDRLSIKLRDETGAMLTGSNDNFFIFKFICNKKNLQ